MNYFVMRNGQQYGPYSMQDLQRYVAQGNISPTDMARSDQSAQLIPVQQIIGAAPAPPAAPPQPQPGQYGAAPAAAPVYPQPIAYGVPVAPVVPVGYAMPPKSRTAFILLGIFLGCFGAHNFYAGYTGRAVAQLLITICTIGIGALVTGPWAIIEVIVVNRDRTGAFMV